LIEHWTWFDSFYVAVITMTSIGYGQPYAMSIGGRVLTIVLAMGGIGAVAVAAVELLSTIVTGELGAYVGEWRMGKRIDALTQHVIVCGYGRVGQHVCADLLGSGVPVVAIDRRAEALMAARDAGALPVLGDATVDATLRQAGIEHARALVAVAGNDPENILITMTARLISQLPILSRAEEESAVAKLLRAGATRTARPNAIAGWRMAQAVLHPAVVDADLQMEEQLVLPGSPLDGKTVGQCGLRARRGRLLVAIRRRDGRVAFNPDDDAPVSAGDVLITLESGERLDGAGARAFS
jgi:voltage-gated potassium channel